MKTQIDWEAAHEITKAILSAIGSLSLDAVLIALAILLVTKARSYGK